MNRTRRLGLAAAVIVVALALLALAASTPVGVTSSQYGYSVTVATNATLADVTLLLPLPADAAGTGPTVAAFRAGDATIPAGWKVTVTETEHGPMLRLEAGAVSAERQPDGRLYATYDIAASAPATGVVDARDPYGSEPTVGPVDGRREIPCPNLAWPGGGENCYAFTVPVFVDYVAPSDASVDLYIVTTGSNEFLLGGRRQYYERVVLFLDGPQGGWLEAEGFASTAG